MASINNLQTVYADKMYLASSTGLSEIGETYTTQTYVDSAIVGAGGVSQATFDAEIATLQGKDISYNNTLNSHIALIAGHGLTINSTLTDIGVLDGKQIQNFNNINAINADLTNNYQTTTQLNVNFVSPTTLTTNHYTKSQIDTTLGNYSPSAQIGTTLGNYYTSAVADTLFYSQTYINNNIYNKTEVDALVGAGGGYTDPQIDTFFYH